MADEKEKDEFEKMKTDKCCCEGTICHYHLIELFKNKTPQMYSKLESQILKENKYCFSEEDVEKIKKDVWDEFFDENSEELVNKITDFIIKSLNLKSEQEVLKENNQHLKGVGVPFSKKENEHPLAGLTDEEIKALLAIGETKAHAIESGARKLKQELSHRKEIKEGKGE